MMGNSYLRQAFEALSCGWYRYADATDYRAAINTTACYSLACMADMEEQGKELKFVMDEIGNFTSLLPEAKKSCVGADKSSSSCEPTKVSRAFYE